MYRRDDGPMTRANGHPEAGAVGTARSLGNSSGGSPLVVSLKSADIGELDDLAKLGRLDGTMFRRVHLQGLVNPPAMLEVDVAW